MDDHFAGTAPFSYFFVNIRPIYVIPGATAPPPWWEIIPLPFTCEIQMRPKMRADQPHPTITLLTKTSSENASTTNASANGRLRLKRWSYIFLLFFLFFIGACDIRIDREYCHWHINDFCSTCLRNAIRSIFSFSLFLLNKRKFNISDLITLSLLSSDDFTYLTFSYLFLRYLQSETIVATSLQQLLHLFLRL